jgi:glucose-1-phosphate cytidylyltransferase
MKTIILCGGRGTRLDEMGKAVPKALVPVGGKPLIWHLMRHFAAYGHDEFVLCLGFLSEKIVEYFRSVSVDSFVSDTILHIDDAGLRCRVELVDTGLDTNTGGRVAAVSDRVSGAARFFVTYGDGLSDVDLDALVTFHEGHGKTATLTAVHPISNFGILELDDDGAVKEFKEKPILENWINGGFFVFERAIFGQLGENNVLEKEPLSRLSRAGELMAYKHNGFWKCLDTYKDNLEMNQLWDTTAPWKNW